MDSGLQAGGGGGAARTSPEAQHTAHRRSRSPTRRLLDPADGPPGSPLREPRAAANLWHCLACEAEYGFPLAEAECVHADGRSPVAVSLAECAPYGPRAGGKALGLATLLGAGLRVPDGFVVLGAAPLPDTTGVTPVPEKQLLAAFDKAFGDDGGDVTVAVRSSAGGEDGVDESWAGVNESVLGVTRDALADAVARVRGRVGVEDRAAAYAAGRSAGADGSGGDGGAAGDEPLLRPIGCVVQKMVHPAVSGVAFSRHPVTSADVVLIEAVHGLGTTAVGGRVIPEQVIVAKPPPDLRPHNMSAAASIASSAAACKVLGVREAEQRFMAIAPPAGPSAGGGRSGTDGSDGSVDAPARASRSLSTGGSGRRLTGGAGGAGGDGTDEPTAGHASADDSGTRGADGEIEVDIPISLRRARKLTDAQACELAAQVAALETLHGHPIDVEWAVSSDDGKLYLLQCRPISVLAAPMSEEENAAAVAEAVSFATRSSFVASPTSKQAKKRKYDFWFSSRKKLWRAESTADACADVPPEEGSGCIDFLRLRDSFAIMEGDRHVAFFNNMSVEAPHIEECRQRVTDPGYVEEYARRVAACEGELRSILTAALDADLAAADTDQLAALWERCLAHHKVALSLYPVGGPLITSVFQTALEDAGLTMAEAVDLMTPLEDDTFQREQRAFAALVAAHIVNAPTAADEGGDAPAVAVAAAGASATLGGGDEAGSESGVGDEPVVPTPTPKEAASELSPSEAIAHVRQFPHLAANHVSLASLVTAVRARFGAAVSQALLSAAVAPAAAAATFAAATAESDDVDPADLAAVGAAAASDEHELRAARGEALCAARRAEHPTLGQTAACARTLCNCRLRVKTCYVGVDLALIPIVDEIARRSGEDADSIHWLYRGAEVSDLIRRGADARLPLETLTAREAGYVFVLRPDGVDFHEGADATAKFRTSVSLRGDGDDEVENGELAGMVASQGTCRGTARVLLSGDSQAFAAALSRVKEGDVLVTQMTQPDLVGVIERCGGVVTDEGGILSHAAIISREFGIPCVVGTGRATRTIREGDDVEIVGDGTVVNHSWKQSRLAVPGGVINSGSVENLLSLAAASGV